MATLMLFAKDDKEYVVILDDEDDEDPEGYCIPGYKLTASVQFEADVHKFPLGETLRKD